MHEQRGAFGDAPVELHDLSGRSRKIAGVFRPKTLRDFGGFITRARRLRKRIHTVSCGRNWGFGSHLPPQPNALLLDLSGMTRVRKLDLEHGYAEVDPGVTQGILDEALRKKGRSHYFNVTGAGLSTSVIGNALERGIGYFGGREADILDLQVMRGDGSTFWTNNSASNPYHTGLGPGLRSLFFQSNFGVIIGAKIRLMKRAECMAMALLRIRDEAGLGNFVRDLGALRQEGCFHSVPHIANRQRMLSTFGPHVAPDILAKISETFPAWSCAIPLAGSAGMVQEVYRHLLQRLDIPTGEGALLTRVSVKQEPIFSSLIDLAEGIPNDFALPSVSWSALGTSPSQVVDLDAGPAGLIHVTPTCVPSKEEVKKLLSLVANICTIQKFRPLPMTLNLVNPGLLALIISIPFDRRDFRGQAEAREIARAISKASFDQDFTPYRLGLDESPQCEGQCERSAVLQRFSEAMNSSNIFCPSKYDPLWRRPIPTPTKKVGSRCRGELVL